jgi:hypothetical protein
MLDAYESWCFLMIALVKENEDGEVKTPGTRSVLYVTAYTLAPATTPAKGFQFSRVWQARCESTGLEVDERNLDESMSNRQGNIDEEWAQAPPVMLPCPLLYSLPVLPAPLTSRYTCPYVPVGP